MELPPEVWMLVLRHVKEPVQLVKLEPVCRTFRSVILNNFWARIKRLQISSSICYNHQRRLDIVIDYHQWQGGPEKALVLVECLANKGFKLESMKLRLGSEDRDNVYTDILVRLIDCVSTSFKDLHLELTDFTGIAYWHPLVAFVSKFSRTLKSLYFELYCAKEPESLEDRLAYVHLRTALKSCDNLESAEIHLKNVYDSGNFLNDILAGKQQLKSLFVDCDCWGISEDNLVDALLASPARLLACGVSCKNSDLFIQLYFTRIQNSLPARPHHPLQTLKQLWVRKIPANPHRLLQLCPQLEMINITTTRSDFVNELISSFLLQYAAEEKGLVIQATSKHALNRWQANSLFDRLRDNLKRFVKCDWAGISPVVEESSSDETSWQVNFGKGRAWISIRGGKLT